MARLSRGTIQVYTGDGKGKTTAALGQVFRGLGHDLRAMVIMFMKGNVEYGELQTARKLAPQLEIREAGRETFVSRDNPDPEDIRMAQEGLELARQVVDSGETDLVVLDEINVAVDFRLVEVSDVLQVCRNKPDHVELILTGRWAHPEILAVADLVTEMKSVKHHYDSGLEARIGIER